MSKSGMVSKRFPFVLMIVSITLPWRTIPIDRSLEWCQASDRPDRRIPQPSVCGIGDIFRNASGCYLLDFEQDVAYDVKVSHVSGMGEFLIRDPKGGVIEGYEWENPPHGGVGTNLDASYSGIYSLEIEGVCHVQVSRSLWMMVGADPVTLRGVLGENRSIYGYYIWIFQSGAEHPSDLVEVEVKLKVPEGADFNLYEADMFFTEPSPAEDRRAENHGETLVYGNGPEGLLLFVQRASGEGEYVLTVRAYVAYWKIYWHLLAIIVVVSLAISGIAVLSKIASKKTIDLALSETSREKRSK